MGESARICRSSHIAQSEHASRAHQFDEVLGHAEVVLIHSMDHGIDEGLLVAIAQLGHIAEVNVGNAPIPQCKNVACGNQDLPQQMVVNQSSGVALQSQGLSAAKVPASFLHALEHIQGAAQNCMCSQSVQHGQLDNSAYRLFSCLANTRVSGGQGRDVPCTSQPVPHQGGPLAQRR